jgi:hypothetical protein
VAQLHDRYDDDDDDDDGDENSKNGILNFIQPLDSFRCHDTLYRYDVAFALSSKNLGRYVLRSDRQIDLF